MSKTTAKPDTRRWYACGNKALPAWDTYRFSTYADVAEWTLERFDAVALDSHNWVKRVKTPPPAWLRDEIAHTSAQLRLLRATLASL